MATAYLADTPSRVLRRVQLMEDMELPSLPSFQHDLDYDSESVLSDHSQNDDEYNGPFSQIAASNDAAWSDRQDLATPHPVRPVVSPSDYSFSTTGSPFPPATAAHRVCLTPSPNAGSALTSTPYSHQSHSRRVDSETRSTRHERTRSKTDTCSSNVTSREKWHTPAEMSGSFSGDEILDARGHIGDGDGSVGGNRSSREPEIVRTPNDTLLT